MKKSSHNVLRILFFALIVSMGVATNALSSELIYNSFNAAGTASGPTVPTVFTLTKPTTIAAITNYHWNSGIGQDPDLVNGWIGIEQIVSDSESVMIGRWPAFGKPGAYGAPDTWWYAYPNTQLGPGTYKVVDSDNGTWSYTTYSYPGYADGPNWELNKGFTQIFAAATVTATSPVDGAVNVDSKQAVTITFSEKVNPGPAWDTITITYLKNNDKCPIIKSVPITKSLSDNVLTIVPEEKYRHNKLIAVTLPAGSLQDTGTNPPGATQPEPAYPLGAYQYTFSTSRK